MAVVAVLVSIWRPSLWPIGLAVAGATPTGVVLIAGGFGLATFYFVALCGTVTVLLRLTRIAKTPLLPIAAVPGGVLLIAAGAWITMVTLCAPALFPGLTILGSWPSSINILTPGVYTSANLAQITYLWLSIGIVFLVASTPSATARIVGFNVYGIMGLSFWRYCAGLFGLGFPEQLISNNSTLVYIEMAPGGAPRFRGILSEPAGLAPLCLAAVAFSVALMPRASWPVRLLLISCSAACITMGIASTSTTFVIAGPILLGMALFVFVGSLLRRGGRRFGLPQLGGLLGLLVVAYVAAAPLISFVETQVSAKTASDSYNDRSDSDAFSLGLIGKTLGFGVGLGSNRSSSMLTSLLSSVGVVGTLLLLAAVLVLVWKSWRFNDARPVAWVVVALLVSKSVSGPDLAEPNGLLFLSLGVLAGIVYRAAGGPSEASGDADASVSGRQISVTLPSTAIRGVLHA